MGEVRCLLRPEGGSDIFLSGESAPITYSISMGGAPSFNDLWVSEHVDRQIQGHRQSVGKPSKWSLIFEDQSPSFVEIKHLWLLGRGRGSGQARPVEPAFRRVGCQEIPEPGRSPL